VTNRIERRERSWKHGDVYRRSRTRSERLYLEKEQNNQKWKLGNGREFISIGSFE
jgi:hypothetical protein